MFNQIVHVGRGRLAEVDAYYALSITKSARKVAVFRVAFLYKEK